MDRLPDRAAPAVPGLPAGSTELECALLRLCAERGPFKDRLERLLVEIDGAEADALMMLLKESRGAWAVLLGRASGHVLFCGNALSGTPVALASLGLNVTVVDRSIARLAFCRERANALVPGTTRVILAGLDAALPFADRAFAVAIQEDGLPSAKTAWGHGTAELRRVASEEVLVTADNRLGYKRSKGRRGAFQRDPRVLAHEIIRPGRGERTLPTTAAAVRGDWENVDAFALYPHAREFSHVVALDGGPPFLTIGPREKKNWVKVVGHRLGLFKWLTPSFAVHAKRTRGTSRLGRMIDELANRIGEPTPAVDVLVATRSNDALVHTAPVGARSSGGSSLDADPAGRWTLHIPLQPSKRRMVGIHHEWLLRVRRDHPDVLVPEPLFLGQLEGVDVAVERRVGGLGGTDVTGEIDRTHRMFQDAATQLASLVDRDPTPIDGGLYDEVFRERFERVIRLVRSPGTARTLEKMARRVEARLLGESVRLAAYHADLRGKHVRVDADGGIVGILDWGASEPRFLPGIDLAHLVVHQRKQEVGGRFGDAWRQVQDPASRRPHEAAAFETYAGASGLAPGSMEFILSVYPLLVAGMAERNWDYSRPDWVARQFAP